MSSTQRFLALDIFRGMTVCFMIIVNTPGNGSTSYAPLHHAHWHGFTPTDLVFPSFLFAVGNALSFVSRKWGQMTDAAVLAKIFKRTIIIFILGYLMYWFPFVHWTESGELALKPFSHTRVFGVLQRIALAYGAAALMIRYCKPGTLYRLSLVLILVYWLVLLLFGDQQDPYSMLGNAGTYLDKWLLGENHLYHGEGVAFDPEGLLSTLPAVANVTFGYAAGRWIQEKGKSYEGIFKLMLVGAVLIFTALCWNNFWPVNKKLWTGSFVFLTVGIDCILLAALVYLTDFLQVRRWGYFFEVLGKNPLFIYLLSELGAILLWFIPVGEARQTLFNWLYQTVFLPAGAYFGSFLFSLAFMMVCWGVGYWLDRKKIYIRV